MLKRNLLPNRSPSLRHLRRRLPPRKHPKKKRLKKRRLKLQKKPLRNRQSKLRNLRRKKLPLLNEHYEWILFITSYQFI